MSVLLLSTLLPLFLHSPSVSLFILAVPMLESLGHSCMSTTFSTTILDSFCFFLLGQQQVHNVYSE